jgi:hypothetical protein
MRSEKETYKRADFLAGDEDEQFFPFESFAEGKRSRTTRSLPIDFCTFYIEKRNIFVRMKNAHERGICLRFNQDAISILLKGKELKPMFSDYN